MVQCTFYIIIQVTIKWRTDLLYIPNLQTLYCLVSALSPSPDIISSFELVTPPTYVPLQNALTISVEWSRPVSMNGSFKEYVLCLFFNENATLDDELECHTIKQVISHALPLQANSTTLADEYPLP